MAHINTKSASKAACILHELVFPSAPHMPQFLKESALLLFDCLRLICDGSFHDNAAPEMLWCTPGNRQTSSKEEGFVSVTEKQVRSGHCATTRTATTVSSCSISSLSILPFSWKSLKVGVDYFEVHDSNRWAYFQGAFVSKWFRPFSPFFWFVIETLQHASYLHLAFIHYKNLDDLREDTLVLFLRSYTFMLFFSFNTDLSTYGNLDEQICFFVC